MNDNIMYGFKVNIEQVCTESHHSEEAYGDWYTSHDNTFNSVEKIHKYPDLVSVENLIQGNPVHVVWCEWSSGDSFGNGNRCSVEGIAVFSKYEDAVGLKKAIESGCYGKYKAGYKFVASTGQLFECAGYAPWGRYFENLDDVHIDTTHLR